MPARALIVLLFALFTAVAGVTPATADDRPGIPWTGTNPYGFAIGDSVLRDCGEQFGVGWRSLGMVGWPGADTRAMRDRLTQTSEGWDWTTEDSNAMERLWFRDAGWLVIGLGTIDVKTMSAEEFRGNVDWFLAQAGGRPVLWFTIVNPPFQPQVDAFNAVLAEAAGRWPNLKIMDWARWVQQNPGSLSDGVHAAYPSTCTEGRDRLIRHAAPDVPGETRPRGYWYEEPSRAGSFRMNGWGATNTPNLAGPLQVNVRADFWHVGRWPVDQPSSDLWARTASGRAFGVGMGGEWRGRLLCLDLVDAAGQFTPLGCRTH